MQECFPRCARRRGAHTCRWRKIERHIIVSMMVLCNDNIIAIIEHDERRLGLSNVSVLMKHGNNITEI